MATVKVFKTKAGVRVSLFINGVLTKMWEKVGNQMKTWNRENGTWTTTATIVAQNS